MGSLSLSSLLVVLPASCIYTCSILLHNFILSSYKWHITARFSSPKNPGPRGSLSHLSWASIYSSTSVVSYGDFLELCLTWETACFVLSHHLSLKAPKSGSLVKGIFFEIWFPCQTPYMVSAHFFPKTVWLDFVFQLNLNHWSQLC